MKNNEMFHFIGRCLALYDNPGFKAEILEAARSSQVDWQHFVSLCSNHLVLPIIYLKFKDHGILEHLPAELSEHLQQIHALNVTRNNQIIKQIREIVKVLNQNNIHPVFLKGAAHLLDDIYSDPGERILGDIDFLVAEQDYFPAAEAMKEQGYEFVDDANLREYHDISSQKHYPRLYHPEFIASIEIHRTPSDEKYVRWFNTETIDQDKKEVAILSGCYVPADQKKIIHNFVHSQLSNEGNLYGHLSLREVYDLYLLSKRFPLNDTLQKIKTKQKAIAYYSLCGSVLGLNESFFPSKNFAFRVLSKKHKLNQNSYLFYQVNRSVIFIFQRIFGGYIGQIIKAFYSKDKRQYLSRRIKDPKWYGDHVRLYARFFKHQ